MPESLRDARLHSFAEPEPEPTRASRRQFLGYAGAGMLAAWLPGCGGNATSAAYGETIAWARQQCQALLSGDVVALSVALLKGNRIVWQEAFGTAAPHVAATPQTRFNVNSVSKVVAALAGVILQDRGKLDLDTPIVRYLPSFTMLSPEYTQITTRHLLSHSSGFPGVTLHDSNTLGGPAAGLANATQAMLANSHLKHLPGEMAVYCNDGFAMFELVVAAVTGQSYVDFVQQTILAPLNMTHSGFLTSTSLAPGAYAMPYRKGAFLDTLEFVNGYASGGLNTTPADMMNLAQMFMNRGVFNGTQIASSAAIAQMAMDQGNLVGLRLDPVHWPWGLGWDQVKEQGLAAAGVTGWWKGGDSVFFSADFFVLPDAQMALMLLGSQSFEVRRLPLAEQILARALAEDGTIGAVPASIAAVAPPAASAPNVASAAGIYGSHDKVIQVEVNADGSLALNQYAGNGTGASVWKPLVAGATRYQYRSDGWWWSDGDPASYAFTVASGTDSNGQAYRYRYLLKRALFGAGYATVVTPEAQQLASPQSASAPELSAAWKARLGTQYTATSEAANNELLVLNDGTMTMAFGQLSELPGYVLSSLIGDFQLLVPLADDRGGMAVKVPVFAGRDLYEVVFSGNTVTAGGVTFRP
ncbi:serine hydrolase domain-containing protein [Burkholderia anthina]|uniref:serine hydrolase domain-containing protein n=1 Tax=Burkholderia anthina TaxID=179879 RepID=UPI00272D86E7